MTLQEILDAIFEKYPHDYPPDNIIAKINTLQKELFRTIYKPIVPQSYDLLAGNPYYPITYSPSKVVDIVVNGVEYESVNIKGKASTNWYWFTDDNCIGVYPTPSEDSAAGLVVFRYKEPAVLTTGNLGAIPDFDHDFHMILVYRICEELAENAREFDNANGFITKINGLLQEFNKGKQEPDYIQIQDTYGGCMLL